MTLSEIENLIQELNQIESAQDLIIEIFNRFKNRAIIGTSGQLSGSVIIDMASKGPTLARVFTLDTLRLFPETYSYFETLEKKYSLQIEKIKPDPFELKKMLDEEGEFLFFNSKEKQELCCQIRKVNPNQKILDTVDVWISGLRADQSSQRRNTPRFEIIPQQTLNADKSARAILKVSPLYEMKEKELREYAQQNNVPLHPLLQNNQAAWFYESLGCIICTTPISQFESRRAGRWRWFNALNPDQNKECGLHFDHLPKK